MDSSASFQPITAPHALARSPTPLAAGRRPTPTPPGGVGAGVGVGAAVLPLEGRREKELSKIGARARLLPALPRVPHWGKRWAEGVVYACVTMLLRSLLGVVLAVLTVRPLTLAPDRPARRGGTCHRERPRKAGACGGPRADRCGCAYSRGCVCVCVVGTHRVAPARTPGLGNVRSARAAAGPPPRADGAPAEAADGRVEHRRARAGNGRSSRSSTLLTTPLPCPPWFLLTPPQHNIRAFGGHHPAR